MAQLLAVVVSFYFFPAALGALARKNVVFLVVESTDGRTWREGYSNDVIPLPTIRFLQSQGASFERHYSNTPVCCPSRATFWSGRHAHRIPHTSALGGLNVGGVWNNYEGLPEDYDERIDQILQRNGYATKLTGKLDFTTGGHSENVYLDAWTKYVQFPYDIPAGGGFYTEIPDEQCHSNGSVYEEEQFQEDWDATEEALSFAKNAPRPWFVYTGHKIVHPPYRTSDKWSAVIDRDKVTLPKWIPPNEMHPCDFQHSMRKGCLPAAANETWFYDADRIKEVRAVYYAMIAEYDAIVGRYVDELWDNSSTVFVVTSDHGDHQMEHQATYKMSPYDASASVPLVIAPLGLTTVVTIPTQLVDLKPTVLDIAGLAAPDDADGLSLLPLARGDAFHRDFVVSQFHGDDAGMSWFAVVGVVDGRPYKLVKWGDGTLHDDLLFDLEADPDEGTNLASSSQKKTNEKVVEGLDSKLRSVVDYATVAHDVAQYNFDSLEAWIAKVGDGWQSEMHKPGLRWDVPFDVFLDEAFDAIDAFRHANDPRRIYPCRNASSAHPLPSQGQGGKKRTPLLLEKKRQKVTASRT